MKDPVLSREELFTCLRLLTRELSVPFWITGGVGIDLLLGMLTRPHGDIDLCVDRKSRAAAFAEISRAGFRVTRDLGWHTRWSRGTRQIGELDVTFMAIDPDGSAVLIVCPDDGIGEPGRYPESAGAFDLDRYATMGDIRCRIASAESQWRLRRGYKALFPVAGDDPKVEHDLKLLSAALGPDRVAALAGTRLTREELQPEDCGG